MFILGHSGNHIQTFYFPCLDPPEILFEYWTKFTSLHCVFEAEYDNTEASICKLTASSWQRKMEGEKIHTKKYFCLVGITAFLL